MNNREFTEAAKLVVGAFEIAGYIIDEDQARHGMEVLSRESYADVSMAIVDHVRIFESTAPSTQDIRASMITRKVLSGFFGEGYRLSYGEAQ